MAVWIVSFAVLVLQLSYSLSEYTDIPEKCKRPPPGEVKPHECCKVPEIFPAHDLEECGFTKLDDLKKTEPKGPPECSKQLCLLKKHNLLKNEMELDLDAIGSFLDEWTYKNPDYLNSVAVAKKACLLSPIPGPPAICDANKLVFCIGATILSECPHWEETESCSKLKNHIDECKSYFRPK